MSWNDGERKFTLAIDHDDTYTLDPTLWDAFIQMAKERGHKVVCVTCRPETEENVADCDVPGVLTYFTNMAPKAWYMKEKGIEVDIWLDDCPDCVLNGR
jgi:hypothetical protein